MTHDDKRDDAATLFAALGSLRFPPESVESRCKSNA
jgi:hypothetical protein